MGACLGLESRQEYASLDRRGLGLMQKLWSRTLELSAAATAPSHLDLEGVDKLGSGVLQMGSSYDGQLATARRLAGARE